MGKKINEDVRAEFLIKFGKHIAKLRKEKKLTQSQLAKLCATDTGTVSRAERGQLNIKISSVIILAQGLDVPIYKILEFQGIVKCKETILSDE